MSFTSKLSRYISLCANRQKKIIYELLFGSFYFELSSLSTLYKQTLISDGNPPLNNQARRKKSLRYII